MYYENAPTEVEDSNGSVADLQRTMKEPGIGMVGAGLVEAPLACFAQGVRALAGR